MAVLGCIADDFTGATDLAGLIARGGVTVSLRLGLPDNSPADTPSHENAVVEIVALKCRTAPVEKAVAECRAALGWLRGTGARQFFWKYCSTFDSTATGNIGPVARALMQDLGTDQTIYCPAFPENGRRVFMGNLFVGRQPLSESPLKDHPLTPMRDSDLLRLLAPQLGGDRVGLIDWPVIADGAGALRAALARLHDDGVAHVVTDAIADDDLATIARATTGLQLLTGGSALARPLPALWREKGLIPGEAEPFTPPPLAPGAVVLSGSCSAMTRAQVAACRDRMPHLRLDPLELAVSGAQAARDWLAAQPVGQPVMIYATAEPEQVQAAQARLGVAGAGEVVESTLAKLAQDARVQGRARFVIAGGESSGAVARALGVKRLMIGPEIAPGVPWTFATDGQGPLALALKSGNFGTESFFTDALRRL